MAQSASNAANTKPAPANHGRRRRIKPSRYHARGESASVDQRHRLSAALAAAILFETAEDDTDELPSVLAGVTPAGGQPHAEGGGEAFEVFDAGVLQTVGVDLHARADT